jgi:hypothetical protein
MRSAVAFDAVAAKINRIARAANALNRDVQKQLNMARRRAAGSLLERATSMIGTGTRWPPARRRRMEEAAR